MVVQWFFLVYLTTLISELGGDKSLLSVGALATRFRSGAVLAGLVLAFAGKSAAAVLLGRSITRLPAGAAASLSMAALVWAAVSIWRSAERPHAGASSLTPGHTSGAMGAAFSSVFFSEWADPGQLAAATLASQLGAPVTVWLAATLAMSTKGALALGVGRVLQRHVSDRTLRLAGTATCLLMAVITAFRFGR